MTTERTPTERLNRLVELYRQTHEGTVMLALNLHEEAYDEQSDDLETAAIGLDFLAVGLNTMYERVKLLDQLVAMTESTKREGGER
jgi:hypothetical protein